MLVSREMTRQWLLTIGVLCAANTGCLLSDPINEPPVVGAIEGPDSIGRGPSPQFSIRADTGNLQWGRFAGTCPADLASQPRAVLGTPLKYNDTTFAWDFKDLGPICLWVLARDDQGAETLVWKNVTVQNQPPTPAITINGAAKSAPGLFPLYQEIRATGTATDPDGDALAGFVWTLTLPDGTKMLGKACPQPTDGSALCFLPPGPGKYSVSLEVSDNQGKAGSAAEATFEVRPDQLPCARDTEGTGAGTILRRWDEDVAFTVAVDDDGDPFPPRESKTSHVDFVWLLRKKEPGKQPQFARLRDYNQASFRLPAQSFVQGDEIEVRVEVMDRAAAPVACADSEPLCMQPSANATALGASTATQCSQRLTWTVRYVL